MTDTDPFSFGAADYDMAEAQAVITMSEDLARTMCIARALVEHGRDIDLAGLDRGVGLLCAKALDLAPERGRTARPYLQAVAVEADRLAEALRTQAQP